MLSPRWLRKRGLSYLSPEAERMLQLAFSVAAELRLEMKTAHEAIWAGSPNSWALASTTVVGFTAAGLKPCQAQLSISGSPSISKHVRAPGFGLMDVGGFALSLSAGGAWLDRRLQRTTHPSSTLYGMALKVCFGT